MRIAFDLDDTLIPCAFRFPLERPPLLARVLGCEPLRLGARPLLRRLRLLGHELWVYTSSLRDPWSVRLQFLSYGIWLGGVVTGDNVEHCRRLRGEGHGPRHCSKYPPTFGIHLLIDDLEGVRMEGDRFGFRVLHLAPDDEGWAEKVLAAVAGRSIG